MKWVCVLIVSLCTIGTQAQSAQDIVEEYAAELQEEDALTDEAQESLADLLLLSENPININTADEDDLLRLPFISQRQAQAIVRYRRNVGKIETFDELILCGALSEREIDRLGYFTSVDDVDSLTLRHRFNKLNAIIRTSINRPKSQGFEGKFLGRPLGFYLRAEAEGSNTWAAGLIAENDIGEPALNRHGTSLTDYTGGYALFQTRGKALRRLVVGNYNIRLGQGMGIWTGFGMDNFMTDISVDKRGRGVSKTLSASEGKYMRGVATDLRIGRIWITTFASLADADATLHLCAEDSSTYIMTINTSGLHRTESERKKRHSNSLAQGGAYTKYFADNFTLGIGGNVWHSEKALFQGNRAYREHYPEGHNVVTLHADYRLICKRTLVYAEVATQRSEATAFTAGADIALRREKNLSIAARHFGQEYYPISQKPYSRTSACGGETGLRIGFQMSPAPKLDLHITADAYRLRNMGIGAYPQSAGLLAYLLTTYKFSRRNHLALRVRHLHKAVCEKETWPSGTQFYESNTHVRLKHTFLPTERLTLTTLAETCANNDYEGNVSYGGVASQSIKILLARRHLTIDAVGNYFKADNYATRVYTRRPNVLYDMNFPVCYGHGISTTIMTKIAFLDDTFNQRLNLWLHAHAVRYFDCDNIGTGDDMTRGNKRITLKVQLQWRLYR